MKRTTSLLCLMLVLATSSLAQTTDVSDPDYAALFEQGAEYGQFVNDAERRVELWNSNTERASLTEELSERLAQVEGQWYLLAVAVDGCSDSVNTVPYLAHMAAASESIDIRIVHPDQGRFIMEANRTPDDRPATPTVLLLDADYQPAGVFIERPTELQDWALGEGESLSSSEFRRDKQAWYDNDAGLLTMHEVLALIEAASSDQP